MEVLEGAKWVGLLGPHTSVDISRFSDFLVSQMKTDLPFLSFLTFLSFLKFLNMEVTVKHQICEDIETVHFAILARKITLCQIFYTKTWFARTNIHQNKVQIVLFQYSNTGISCCRFCKSIFYFHFTTTMSDVPLLGQIHVPFQ